MANIRNDIAPRKKKEISNEKNKGPPRTKKKWEKRTLTRDQRVLLDELGRGNVKGRENIRKRRSLGLVRH